MCCKFARKNKLKQLDRKIRVGAVNYLNTKPLIYGFEQGMMEETVELTVDYPAKLALMLLDDTIDIGLIPVAAIPTLREHHITGNYCIGCNGAVASVCVFSEVPLQQVTHLLLDYQSRTSVALLKILLQEHWHINPVLQEAAAGYETQIKGTTAGLVIGDRAFKQRIRSKYIYDLGTAWKELTGLPFVFAAWVANKKLDEQFIQSFNLAVGTGLQHLNTISATAAVQEYSLYKYYSENISYILDADKQKALALFLEKIALLRQ
jgi:chorismate dehydratase